jgi:hypothetical protein
LDAFGFCIGPAPRRALGDATAFKFRCNAKYGKNSRGEIAYDDAAMLYAVAVRGLGLPVTPSLPWFPICDNVLYLAEHGAIAKSSRYV